MAQTDDFDYYEELFLAQSSPNKTKNWRHLGPKETWSVQRGMVNLIRGKVCKVHDVTAQATSGCQLYFINAVAFEAPSGHKDMIINTYDPLPRPTEADMARFDLKLVQAHSLKQEVSGDKIVNEASGTAEAVKMEEIARMGEAAKGEEAVDLIAQ